MKDFLFSPLPTPHLAPHGGWWSSLQGLCPRSAARAAEPRGRSPEETGGAEGRGGGPVFFLFNVFKRQISFSVLFVFVVSNVFLFNWGVFFEVFYSLNIFSGLFFKLLVICK